MLENPQELDRLGILQYHAGALQASVQWLALAIEEAEKQRDQETEFMARGHLSEAYTKLGDFQNAIDAATVLLTKARAAEDPRHAMRAMSLMAIGIEKQDLRCCWDRFRGLIREALSIARAGPSDGYWEVQNLETLGAGYLRMRDLKSALHWLQTALNAVRSDTFEAVFFRTRLYNNLAELARLHGNCDQAQAYVEAAYETATENDETVPHLICGVRIAHARTLGSVGDLSEALDLIEQAIGDSVRANWRYEEQLCQRLRSEFELDLRHGPEANEAAERALKLATDMGMVEERIQCLQNAGRSRQLLGEYDPAYAHFREAFRLAADRGFSDYMAAAQRGARDIGRSLDEAVP